jgi:hypothetical protein
MLSRIALSHVHQFFFNVYLFPGRLTIAKNLLNCRREKKFKQRKNDYCGALVIDKYWYHRRINLMTLLVRIIILM